MNGKGKIVCGAKKCAGFKYQYKPKALLCRKNLQFVKGWDVGACYYILSNRPCVNNCLVGASSGRMAGLWQLARHWQNMSVGTSFLSIQHPNQV